MTCSMNLALGYEFSVISHAPARESRYRLCWRVFIIVNERGSAKAPTGHGRKGMSERIHLTGYGQRWRDETVFSMIKRRQGSAVNGTTYWSQCRGLMLMAITHNILILYALITIAMTA